MTSQGEAEALGLFGLLLFTAHYRPQIPQPPSVYLPRLTGAALISMEERASMRAFLPASWSIRGASGRCGFLDVRLVETPEARTRRALPS